MAKTVGRYRCDEKIGFGNFGVVYKGVDTVTNRVVAIKSLDLDAVNDEVETVQHEVALLAQLSSAESSNVTKYYGTVLEGSKLWIIMDLCYGGSVRTLLRLGPVDDKCLSVLFREITVAVQAIHHEGIIHRDIKAANVLITMTGQVKLCDFGVAAVAPNNAQAKRNTIVGTPYWMAPEVISEGLSYTNKADIWSLGITFYEIVTGNPPHSNQEAMRAMMVISTSRPPRLEGPKYTPALKDLVALCLDEVPEARPPAEELLKHKFIKQHVKTSVTVLRTLVDRYSAWKTKHHDHRDSLLMFNPHKESELNENLSTSSGTALGDEWDFSERPTTPSPRPEPSNPMEDVPPLSAESYMAPESLDDAPDSLRELFGMPPRQDIPPDFQAEFPPVLSLSRQPTLNSHVQLNGTPMSTQSAQSVVSEASSQPIQPHYSQSQPQLSHNTATPATHTTSHNAASHTPGGVGAGGGHNPGHFVFPAPSSEPRVQLTPQPTVISISWGRSTTMASPSLTSSGAFGWRGRHGSETQLDTQNSLPKIPKIPANHIEGEQMRANSEPSSQVVSRQSSLETPSNNIGSLGPLMGPVMGPDSVGAGPLSSDEAEGFFGNMDLNSLNVSDSLEASEEHQLTPEEQDSPASSPSPRARAGNGAKSRVALPRLQMPPRNVMKMMPLMSAPVGNNNQFNFSQGKKTSPPGWVSEFPPMPKIDTNVWLDSTPEKLAEEHLLELLVGYRTAINSLSGQFE